MPGRKKRAGYSSAAQRAAAAAEEEAEAEQPASEEEPAAAPAAAAGGGAAEGSPQSPEAAAAGAPDADGAASPPPAAAAAAADDSSDDGDLAEELSRRPMVVEYCPVCTFPAEFCEFSGKLEQCKPWLEEQLAKGLRGLELEGMKEKGKAKKAPTGELPGGKKKKEKAKEVVVAVTRRGGRKHITTVRGLDAFGHKLDELAKTFKKQFSCGCAVVSNPGQTDAIEVQGDVMDTMLEVLPKKYKIPVEAVWKVEDKEKVKVRYGADGRPEF
eukprot:TRINITY_DN57038_c0_g1_i1.p1 TRINITY_DN57038_c0_g1~~TRINITY_DN57038_c0_g1_i1.p1  ORF type:complete len:270 (+),score=124.46 TRINITY_DN57038_c0_g1_i1:72-881(+)